MLKFGFPHMRVYAAIFLLALVALLSAVLAMMQHVRRARRRSRRLREEERRTAGSLTLGLSGIPLPIAVPEVSFRERAPESPSAPQLEASMPAEAPAASLDATQITSPAPIAAEPVGEFVGEAIGDVPAEALPALDADTESNWPAIADATATDAVSALSAVSDGEAVLPEAVEPGVVLASETEPAAAESLPERSADVSLLPSLGEEAHAEPSQTSIAEAWEEIAMPEFVVPDASGADTLHAPDLLAAALEEILASGAAANGTAALAAHLARAVFAGTLSAYSMTPPVLAAAWSMPAEADASEAEETLPEISVPILARTAPVVAEAISTDAVAAEASDAAATPVTATPVTAIPVTAEAAEEAPAEDRPALETPPHVGIALPSAAPAHLRDDLAGSVGDLSAPGVDGANGANGFQEASESHDASVSRNIHDSSEDLVPALVGAPHPAFTQQPPVFIPAAALDYEHPALTPASHVVRASEAAPGAAPFRVLRSAPPLVRPLPQPVQSLNGAIAAIQDSGMDSGSMPHLVPPVPRVSSQSQIFRGAPAFVRAVPPPRRDSNGSSSRNIVPPLRRPDLSAYYSKDMGDLSDPVAPRRRTRDRDERKRGA